MAANVDLFTIASSGVNASNQLLNTTSRNIANVNTDGYVRERTTFTGSILGSVGQGDTERVINVFAQNQLRRDITSVGELEAFAQKTSTIDNLLASEANSISTGLSKFFASIQTAADDPTNIASRETVMGEAEALVNRMGTMSDYLQDKEEELNLEFSSQVKRANSLLESIGTLNKKILFSQSGSGQEPSTLMNERDLAINELAKMMSVEVREGANGAKAVNLTSGESLVMENGTVNLLELSSGPDTTDKQLELGYNIADGEPQATVRLTEDKLGGSLGGLFRFRNEILGPAQRDIGQIAVAMADAMNSQNKLGMDLDGDLGGDLFTLPPLSPQGYADNSAAGLNMEAAFVAGKGSEMTDADYRVEVDTVDGAGQPLTVKVTALNSDGTVKQGTTEQNITLNTTGPTEFTRGGIEIEFDSSAIYASGDAFLIQPMKNAASELTLATGRGEDLALASPVRVSPGSGNLGDAQMTNLTVTNTQVGESAFDGTGGISASSGAGVNAPVKVEFTSATVYNVLDSGGSILATATVSGGYNNLLEQAGFNQDYPGYDFSLEGLPVAGDSFSVSYNTNGINDNANAVKLAELQQSGLVQLSTNTSSEPRSLHDSYSSLVGRVGEKSANSQISLEAAEAMQEQSQTWFDSVSGVSLDEEAANLVRFQQSYAAAARILSTAQELFDTILSAAR